MGTGRKFLLHNTDVIARRSPQVHILLGHPARPKEGNSMGPKYDLLLYADVSAVHYQRYIRSHALLARR